MNSADLKGKIVAKFGTQEKFAKSLGVTPATVTMKLQNKREMSRSDIARWSELLGILPEDIPKYFFSE